jgi:acetyl esterase/lipase
MMDEVSSEALDGVRLERDVVFGRGGGRELRCNVFVPAGDALRRAAVLVLHGGGWQSGNRASPTPHAVRLSRRGHVCIASDYRLSHEAKWPAALHDVKAAMRWMRAEHAALGIDPQRICVVGRSAGGQLALMAAATAGVAEFEGEGGHAGVDSACACVVAYYAPTDLEPAQSHPDSPMGRLFASDVSAEEIRRASPITWARADFPPTLLLHGTGDAVVSDVESRNMHALLVEAGALAELVLLPDRPHGFDSEPEVAEQCTDIVSAFLELHVGGETRPTAEIVSA